MSFDAFLKITGPEIKGESRDDKHKDWIEVLSYSFGVVQPVHAATSTSGSRSTEKADFQDVSIMKGLDIGSTQLFRHCANGKHIKSLKFEICRAVGNETSTPYLFIDLDDCIVSAYQQSGSAGAGFPSESVSFNFGKIKVHYDLLDHDTAAKIGQDEVWWDKTINKGNT